MSNEMAKSPLIFCSLSASYPVSTLQWITCSSSSWSLTCIDHFTQSWNGSCIRYMKTEAWLPVSSSHILDYFYISYIRVVNIHLITAVFFIHKTTHMLVSQTSFLKSHLERMRTTQPHPKGVIPEASWSSETCLHTHLQIIVSAAYPLHCWLCIPKAW